MGRNEDTGMLVSALVEESQIPLVIDADGINALASNIDVLKRAKSTPVLTPHPGEMARLLGCSVLDVQQNRYTCARHFSERYGAVVVLKGANTLVALPDGAVFVNRTGNPGMARGGSGDVLAGMIASFMAQGIAPELAAVCGVYLHGLAGDRCAKRLSQLAMTPSDLIEELPEIFLQL